MPDDQTFTFEEAAEQVGRNREYIQKEVQRGRLATTGDHNDRISRVELERWWKGTQGGPSDRSSL